MGTEPKFRRVLLKISGETLAGDQKTGLNFNVIGQVCDVIKTCTELGVQVGVVIGGAFFGLGYLVFGSIPSLTAILADLDASATLDDGSSVPPGTSLIILCAIVALLLWGGIHSAFVKPFILISVMRRYIEAGLANPPKVDLYGKLAGMSAGFRKALERDKEEAGAAA